MKNLNLIKEEFFHFNDSPELRNMVKMATCFFDWESEIDFLEKYPYAFVTYIDHGQKRYIHCDVLQESGHAQEQTLVDLLIKQNPGTFSDLLYIVSFYDPLNHWDVIRPASAYSPCLAPPDSFLDQLFLESRGFLAYNHQLEMLYRMLTGCAPAQAIKFRQGLGKKEAWALMEAEIMRFPNGKTLKNVMDERMLGEFTFSPNYPGAMNLYECCFR
jgi:hypothetical protein